LAAVKAAPGLRGSDITVRITRCPRFNATRQIASNDTASVFGIALQKARRARRGAT
jgi:hypothetical protein